MTSLPDQSSAPPLGRNHFSLRNLQTQRYKNKKQSITETEQSQNDLQVVRLNNFAPQSRRKYVIQIYNEGKTIQFTSKATVIEELIYQVKKHLKINKLDFQIKAITSYNLNLAMDILLSIGSVNLQAFSIKNIKIRPYYGSNIYLQGLNGYEVIRAIGSGGFSRVFLVRSKNNGKFYAMKAISKAFILKNKKQKLILNEKNIMVKVNHPFLAKLHHSFETVNYFMLIMDYYPGGQLFGILKRYKRMNQLMAKFYIIQILLGLEQLHINGIAYRDLKPENILLDRDGHACISDFGLAKPGLKSESSRTYSFCGSPQYMPPEIILKKGHSIKADYYSLGALLFQLLTGLPPFYHRNPQEIYEGTLNGVLNCPCFLSENVKDLLLRLLCKSQDQRIGSKKGVQQILDHPWFGVIDRENYLKKKIPPPVSFSSLNTLTFNQQEMTQKNSEYVSMILKQQKIQDYFSHIIPDFQFQREKREGDFKENINSRVSINPLRQKPFEKKRSIKLLHTTDRHKYDNFF